MVTSDRWHNLPGKEAHEMLIEINVLDSVISIQNEKVAEISTISVQMQTLNPSPILPLINPLDLKQSL